MNEEYKGKLAVLVSAAIWGFVGLSLRGIYARGLNVITVFFYMVFFGALMFLIFWKKIDFKPKWKDFKYLIWIMIFGNLNGLLIFYAFKYTKIAIAEFLHYTMPVWAFIIAVFFLKERVGKWRVFALIISMIGISLVFDIKMLFNGMNMTNIGNLCALGSGFAYAGQIAFARKIKTNTYTTNFWNFFMSSFIIFPFYVMNNTIKNPADLGILLAYTLFFTVVAMLLYLYGVQKIQVTKSSIILLFEAVIAVFVAWIFLGEVLTGQNLIGGFLILISSAILIIKKKK